MTRVSLPHTGLSVSPFCLGGVPFGNTIDERATHALLDHFVARGGNFIDTARIYSDWVPGEKRRSERVLGDWIAARCNRDQLVIATKGAHPLVESLDVPRSSAAELRDDLEGSLRTLRVDHVDLYWLHRDDAARPVEHFIDVLNTFLREGKIRAFGASNWTLERFSAANACAAASGQTGFAVNQPLWSLGCQQSRPPPFTGYVKFDAAIHAHHRATGLGVVPYTSQAGGFFSKYALPPEKRPANFTAHEYHTPANLATAEVVCRLATEKGLPPSAIVLAYLRAQPFVVVPIVGSYTPAQLDECFTALAVQLTPAELHELETVSKSGIQHG